VDEEKAREEGRIRQERSTHGLKEEFPCFQWRCFHLHVRFLQKKEKREFRKGKA
jgi:hypothetical protein